MTAPQSWLGQQASFYATDSPELQALAAELVDELDTALQRQATPASQEQLIRAGVGFILNKGPDQCLSA